MFATNTYQNTYTFIQKFAHVHQKSLEMEHCPLKSSQAFVNNNKNNLDVLEYNHHLLSSYDYKLNKRIGDKNTWR